MPPHKGNPNWVKGMESANPGGRPSGVKSMNTLAQEAFAELMQNKIGTGANSPTYLAKYLAEFKDAALKPNSKAFLFVADRLFREDVLDQIDSQMNKAKREDTDFMSYRFFKEFHTLQREAFLSKDSLKLLLWGRRTGKTDFFIEDSSHDATLMANSPIIYFGPTFERAKDLFFRPVLEELKEKGTPILKVDEGNGEIHTGNGSVIYISGTHTTRDRNKWRGRFFRKAYIDECQDQAGLEELVMDILGPAMVDLRGTIVCAGTGPKVRGTFWELMRSDEVRFKGYRTRGNMSHNPFIPDHETVLEEIREKYGFSENDPTYIREYLGGDAYDDDALVLRLTEDNYFEDADLEAWLSDQSPEDVKFMSGMDYGFDASDAHVVILWSEKRNEKFAVWEYKARGTDVTTLVEKIKEAKAYIKESPLFSRSYHRDFAIWADTSDKKISLELTARYGIPVMDAIKVDKVLALQMLQTEVKRGYLKVRRGGPLDEEALRTIFMRTEQGVLTRELDEAYHPDAVFALLYGFRNYWLTHSPEHHVDPPTKPDDPNKEYWEQQEEITRRNQQLY